ncbi:adenylosuccinate synthetase [Hymenobacter metallilatus]|uniref:Adenylosuccinate synthetase n=1 Tax=Hymenobacter metallilatus TaxID=2493666 RepID=A0A3R9MD45_9BACT|nr:adenylosuccinate synthetase [Hymenobacter metallilatus]RSK37487.1 adenylosuccinate synthase [Hymenobacter metallilatus]
MADIPAWVVVGLGFGDEGKGLATDYLCREHPGALVVRFNGGPQAGHTVVAADGRRHVFSSFGAGTLRGSPTYWSGYCPVAPGPLLREYAALRELGVQPHLLLDGRCPVITPYDVLWNRVLEAERGVARHGSCGLGFGSTVERQQTTPLRLYAQDLCFPDVLMHKLRQIRAHYRQRVQQETRVAFDQLNHDAEDQRFADYARQLRELVAAGAIELVREADVLGPAARWSALVFEGAQGVLLDQEFGLFPHVTRSFTTSRNALELLARHQPATRARLLYATRAYHTRHGAGPLPHAEVPLPLINHEQETNQFNEHQEHFRRAPLSVDMLNYALHCDAHFSTGLEKYLLITCLDQLPAERLTAYVAGQPRHIAATELNVLLDEGMAGYVFSRSPRADDLPPLPTFALW